MPQNMPQVAPAPTGWWLVCTWYLPSLSRTIDAIASYLGNSDVFDKAIAAFAVAYADQNERDYQALKDAAATGRITAERGL